LFEQWIQIVQVQGVEVQLEQMVPQLLLFQLEFWQQLVVLQLEPLFQRWLLEVKELELHRLSNIF
jgi:hypothetical protein